ncbi:MAG TPA: hypothetical protein DCX14_11245 [Flavobacteriales bacterium]|jgi:hypothetical protein|nr:hypothetical protein [Flavobacteriales bacterium]
MNHRLYIKPVGGLANRIRVINSALKIAEESKKELIVIWELNQDLNARYEALFQLPTDFKVLNTTAGIQFSGIQLLYFPDKRPAGLRSFLFNLVKLQRGIKEVVWYDSFEAIFSKLKAQYDPKSVRSQEDVLTSALPKIRVLTSGISNPSLTGYTSSSWNLEAQSKLRFNLLPESALAARISKLSIDKSKTVGMHIRRTDHTWSVEHSGDDAFINAIKKELEEDPATKFFVATDSPEVSDKLVALFPEKIIRAEHETMARSSVSGIQSAVIDLYGLAGCRKVYGSFLSTFSDLASNIGSIEAETVT